MSTPFLNFSRIICTNFRQDHASGFWGAGLCGWNCRHTFFAVFPELGDPPQWTQEQLQELNARNIEYNGKKYTAYEISQMQRARERNVRRWKKRYLAEDAAGPARALQSLHRPPVAVWTAPVSACRSSAGAKPVGQVHRHGRWSRIRFKAHGVAAAHLGRMEKPCVKFWERSIRPTQNRLTRLKIRSVLAMQNLTLSI